MGDSIAPFKEIVGKELLKHQNVWPESQHMIHIKPNSIKINQKMNMLTFGDLGGFRLILERV